MDNVPDTIYFKDLDSRFTRINQSAPQRFGVASPGQAIGRTDFDFFTDEHAVQALRDEQEIIRTGQPLVNVEEKETLPDGEVRWVSTTKMPLRDRVGNIVGTFGISRDITHRKTAEEQLQRRAFYDPLTDLPNRALFLDRLQHLFQPRRGARWARAVRGAVSGPRSLQGHQRQPGPPGGRRAADGRRPPPAALPPPRRHAGAPGRRRVHRVAGRHRQESDATRVADRIQKELAAPFTLRDHEVFTSVSVGIALSSAGYE